MKFKIELPHPDQDVMLTVTGTYWPQRHADLRQPGEQAECDIENITDESGQALPDSEIDNLASSDWLYMVVDRAEEQLTTDALEYEASRAEYEYEMRKEAEWERNQ